VIWQVSCGTCGAILGNVEGAEPPDPVIASCATCAAHYGGLPASMRPAPSFQVSPTFACLVCGEPTVPYHAGARVLVSCYGEARSSLREVFPLAPVNQESRACAGPCAQKLLDDLAALEAGYRRARGGPPQ
jgi:hypothetical protein